MQKATEGSKKCIKDFGKVGKKKKRVSQSKKKKVGKERGEQKRLRRQNRGKDLVK